MAAVSKGTNNGNRLMRTIHYSGNPLHRLEQERATNPSLMQNIMHDNGVRFLPLFQKKPLVRADGQSLGWLSAATCSKAGLELTAEKMVLLGQHPDDEHFVVSFDCKDDSFLEHVSRDLSFQSLRGLHAKLSFEEASIAQLALVMSHWHHTHSFCGSCGSKTASLQGGSKRQCISDGCNAQHFPRTDPVVIMCVESEDGQSILLGRKPTHPQGMFSCLAGFLSPGETIEEAVARETKEEAGILVDPKTVEYIASQPWPGVPGGQLMIGCFARAHSLAITKEDDELEDARWFTFAQAKELLDNSKLTSPTPQRTPPPLAIAHTLIAEWISRKDAHNTSSAKL